MKEFWTNRIALSFATVGIILMGLTLIWHVNPVEGSVVPGFLRESLIGRGVLWVLLVTSMPGWIITFLLAGLVGSDHAPGWIPGWFPLFNVMMIVSQGVVCFLLGTVVSVAVRKRSKKNAVPISHAEPE